MVFIWNWMTMKGWNGKKRDNLWISVHFHPHIFILVEFHLDIRNGPSNFRINFSKSDFYKFLLKDEIVRIKMCISTISSWNLIGQISSWNLIGQNLIHTLFYPISIKNAFVFVIWPNFSAAEKCGKFKFSIFKNKIKIGWNGKDEMVRM